MVESHLYVTSSDQPLTHCKFLLWSEVSQRLIVLMVIMGTAWLTVSTLTLFSKRFSMSKYCHCMSGDSCANLDAWALAKSAAVRPREVFWRGSAPAPRRIPGSLRKNSRKRKNLKSCRTPRHFCYFTEKNCTWEGGKACNVPSRPFFSQFCMRFPRWPRWKWNIASQ